MTVRSACICFILAVSIYLVSFGGCSSWIQERGGQEDFDPQERRMVLEDVWPEGCISCHKVSGPQDHTLATIVNEHLQGHPAVDSKNIKECMECHRPGEERFYHRLHVSHMNSRIFTELLDSSCIGCHQMEEKGEIFIKGLR
ncbi:MAG: hypothetical protein CVU88_00780 [Firmicutes bacterium HGW-Firmicutes-13]|nr:MAG: hypothetical protein CVU88_00780 [Firmicutes bacterium HGW-Firmicutes-13]